MREAFPLTCVLGDALLVSAVSGDGTEHIVVRDGDTWRTPVELPRDNVRGTFAFVNGAGHFGSFARFGRAPYERVVTTTDGVALEVHDGSHDWNELPRFLALDVGVLARRTREGTSIGAFGSMSRLDWEQTHPTTSFYAESGAIRDDGTVMLTRVGGRSFVLCDAWSGPSTEYAWIETCHEDVPLETMCLPDLGCSPPQVVALSDGTFAAFYYPRGLSGIRASVRTESGWRPAGEVEVPLNSFRVTTTPSGDVLVLSPDKVVRWRLGAGFVESFELRQRLYWDFNTRSPSVSSGICGDDALIAMSDEGRMSLLRVRGTESAIDEIPLDVGPEPLRQLQVVTRRARDLVHRGTLPP